MSSSFIYYTDKYKYRYSVTQKSWEWNNRIALKSQVLTTATERRMIKTEGEREKKLRRRSGRLYCSHLIYNLKSKFYFKKIFGDRPGEEQGELFSSR